MKFLTLISLILLIACSDTNQGLDKYFGYKIMVPIGNNSDKANREYYKNYDPYIRRRPPENLQFVNDKVGEKIYGNVENVNIPPADLGKINNNFKLDKNSINERDKLTSNISNKKVSEIHSEIKSLSQDKNNNLDMIKHDNNTKKLEPMYKVEEVKLEKFILNEESNNLSSKPKKITDIKKETYFETKQEIINDNYNNLETKKALNIEKKEIIKEENLNNNIMPEIIIEDEIYIPKPKMPEINHEIHKNDENIISQNNKLKLSETPILIHSNRTAINNDLTSINNLNETNTNFENKNDISSEKIKVQKNILIIENHKPKDNKSLENKNNSQNKTISEDEYLAKIFK